MMDISEAEFLDDTSPVDMEEGVNDRNYDKNEKNYEEKEAECLDDNSHYDMEEGLYDRNDDKNEKTMRKKKQNA